MRIHREGNGTLLGVFMLLFSINAPIFYWGKTLWLMLLILAISIIVFIFILHFFRYPKRIVEINDNNIICPCDGKVVVIEETEENEYFKDKRLQISVFMSPLNVHINWYPITGLIRYFKYHKGKYLVAWHPKSSTENERTTTVIRKKDSKKEILMRQIAGAVARRIIWYCKAEDKIKQGDELGFIKFGSRVDLFLPLNVKVDVKLDEIVEGNKTIIARFN